MAITQQSSSSTFTYDVYISFRGKDTRNGFTGNLWKALNDRGINIFIDDQEVLSKGDGIEPAIFKVIQDSKIAIIVLSQNYAASSFLLEELAFIVDNFQHNKDNRFIFPVFYNIDPSSMGNQSGPYGKAFEEHEKKFKDNKEKVQKWRNALSQVADLSEWHFNHSDGHELEFINKIVEEVSRKFDPVPLYNATWKRVFNANTMWRLVGLVSSVTGLSCYALSPSFNRLIGRWEPFKFFLYGVLSLVIFTTILFAKQSSLSTRHVKLKIYTSFAVLMIISVYSFFYDKAMNGKPEILSVVSTAAFALVSLSLHKLVNFGFEIGVFSYFIGCFTVQLLTINWMLIFVAIFLGCPLFVMHSSLNSRPEVAGGGQVIGDQHIVDINL